MPNIKTFLVCHWYQNRNMPEHKFCLAVEVFVYLFIVFILNYKALFVCVKDRACILHIFILKYMSI